MIDFLRQCCAVVGETHVLTSAADMASYLTDQRRRFTGHALAVVRPATTQEVAQIVTLCARFKVPLVPQGGNTGLVLGSVPDLSGKAIVLSLTRLNRIRDLDPLNNTITVEAGCILQAVQVAAERVGRLFPLSLAAEGSCTIGGNLSTNAGGTAVLRYGNARELCLGLEVVTAQGEVWNGLRGLRKDNTGYDLRNLFIGSEGSLGVITAAVLKLFPAPTAKLTAFVATPSVEDALQMFLLAQRYCGGELSAFELMSHACMELVTGQFPAVASPFKEASPQYALIELSEQGSGEHRQSALEALLDTAMKSGYATDAAIAGSASQSQALWALREHIPLAQARQGQNIKHDVSLPISRIADFARQAGADLQAAFPGCRVIAFGHLGDGNLHYNVSAPPGISDSEFLREQRKVNHVVYECVHRFGGSISAEHGLGSLKTETIKRYKSEVEMKMMRAVKRALDPDRIMNPGKVLE